MDGFDGKVFVVTGGAGGIGLAMARRFRRAGMQVVLGDVDQAALDAATAELGDPERVLGVRCDVTSPESVDDLRDAALDRFGAVHLVGLNAGVAPVGMLLETGLDTWRWVLDVNVLGIVHGIRSFCPLLVDQGDGHVICTASAAGMTTSLAMGAYAASKHAVVGIAGSLRAELEPAGVGVSVLCPGALQTRIYDSERNRPTPVSDLIGDATEQLVSRYKAAVAAAPDPAVAADAVHDAVMANRLWVFTSPEVNRSITDRLDAIRAALP